MQKKIAKGAPLSDKFLQKMQKNIEASLLPAENNSNINQLYSQYIVDSMIDNPAFAREIVQSTESKPSIAHFFGQPSRTSAVFETLTQQLTSHIFSKSSTEARLSNVNKLHYTTHAMLRALSLDVSSLSLKV